MIKNKLQLCLDTVLYPLGIFVHEQKKTGADANQYVVYSFSGDVKQAFADDEVSVKSANLTVRYFYRESLLEKYSTKQAVRTIEKLIESTLESNGFEIPQGGFDAGDVDDIGFMVTVFECEYWRAVEWADQST